MECRICTGSPCNVYNVREMLFGYRDQFKYFQCSNCGCLQIVDYPCNLSKYYPSHYYSFVSEKLPWLKALFLRERDKYYLFGKSIIGPVLGFLFPNDLMKIIGKLEMDFTDDTRILDVGCGNGGLLNRLALQGFKILHGIDPYIKDDFHYRNGVIIFKKQLADLRNKYDLIMLNHSLEHMPRQHEVFHNISRLLEKGGICMIRVPIIGYAFDRFKENWVQIDAPRHFYLHTRTSIEILANAADLKLVNVIYDSTEIQLYGSIKYANDVPLVDEYRFSKKEMKQFRRESKRLNELSLGDSAAFIFQS